MSIHSFKVKSIYEYTSPHDDDLYFGPGQIITVTQEEDQEWYSGEYINESGLKLQGIFPKNFVEMYEPTAPPRPSLTIKPKGTERPQEMRTNPTTYESELPNLAANRQLNVTRIVPTSQESSSAQSKSTPRIIDSPPSVKSTKSYGSSPKRIVSSEKPAPPPIFEKPVSSSFKDRVAAFNKPSSTLSPFKPGGFIPGNSSTFIKKPFIAPPPSKKAHISLLRDQLMPNVSCRDEDQNETKRQLEKQINAENPSFTHVEIDAMNQLKPTSLKERIALLQKQQIEHASRLVDAAQKKDKIKRSAKNQVDPSSQTEIADEGINTYSESSELKSAIGRDSLEENDQKKSRKSKPSMEAHPRISCEATRSETSGVGSETQETEKIEHDEKYETSENSASDRTPIDLSQGHDLKNERSTQQDDSQDNDQEDEDENIDAEIKRKEDLRIRMAKIGGGIGMHGIFGPPGGIQIPSVITSPRNINKNTGDKKNVSEDVLTSTSNKTPISAIPLLGMAQIRPQGVNNDEGTNPDLVNTALTHSSDIEEDNSSHEQDNSLKIQSNGDTLGRSIPSIPRSILESNISTSPTTALELDREFLHSALNTTSISSTPEYNHQETQKKSELSDLTSHTEITFEADQITPMSSKPSSENKRVSRPPPPIPNGILLHQAGSGISPWSSGGVYTSTTHEKQLSNTASIENGDEKELHQNEAYVGDASIERSNSFSLPVSPARTPSRTVPPTSPCDDLHPSSKLSSSSRLSIIMPRSAPPPPPTSNRILSPLEQKDDNNDLQEINGSRKRTPSAPAIIPANDQFDDREDDLYTASPPIPSLVIPEEDPSAPSKPPREPIPPLRDSAEISRSTNLNRRSIDLSRISMDSGFVANDIDLAPLSYWWTQPNGIPPVFHGRQDILFESDETSSSDDEKATVTKRIYVLFQDYSQTIVSAHFDTLNPADVRLEQRHEQPPSRPRQDQLELAYEHIGQYLVEAVTACKESVVGDGKPHSLILELLKPLNKALCPVGNRSYGALVYGNIANASTQQNDEIRPGDVITFRNSKFQGKHGPLGAKYTMEVGKPHHVGVVAEWDGTKKKIRAWEQGRENKKVKIESFKLEDLRSGEVKVWRIMPRSWVGWEGQKYDLQNK